MGFPVCCYSELLLPKQLLHLLLLLGYIRRFLLWAFHAVGLGDLLDLGDEQQALLQEHAREHGAPAAQALSPQQHRRAEFRTVPAMVIEEVLPVVRFDELVAAAPAVCGGGDCAVCLSGIGGGDEQALLQEHAREHGAPAAQALSPQQHRRAEFRTVPAMVIEEVLPVVRFDELVAAAPAVCGGGDCAVCLSGIGGGDEVRRLSNCRHVFHRGCLDRWMEHDDQRTCPLCRAPLIPDEMAGALWAAAGVPDASDFDFSYIGPPLTPVPTPTLLRPHELLLTGLGGYQ
uniref:RING-type domain-containing protein n=1 Tax=Oryza punctata TaxID=4537 RepID=A0A0E0KUA7_ORYPU